MEHDSSKLASKGGKERARSLSPTKRAAIARNAAMARWAGEGQSKAVQALYGGPDRPLKIGATEISCYVLSDGTRVLSMRGLQSGIGLSKGGGKRGERKIVQLMANLAEKGIDVRGLVVRANSPIRFILPNGGPYADGYEATMLPDICAVIIDAHQKGVLGKRLAPLAERAAILQHGFATIGIIALVDEATGYQKDRAKDALAKILEAFIAKDLQPWLTTFPSDFYEHMFRLRDLPYPATSVKRPQYFGVLTNNIVYDRLAPGVREELQREVPRNESGRPTAKYFQKLTQNTGYPKLREHLGSIVTLMKLSNKWDDFMEKLDKIHPKFGSTIPLSLEYHKEKDSGKGI
jgi:hypothetical protein